VTDEERQRLPCGCSAWVTDGELHVEPCGAVHARDVQESARAFSAAFGITMRYDDGTTEDPGTVIALWVNNITGEAEVDTVLAHMIRGAIRRTQARNN
jgi:hypothetical protein